MTENRFESNRDFYVRVAGYFAFANMSSNNYTDNYAVDGSGIVELDGMEKQLIMERNRMYNNWVSANVITKLIALRCYFLGSLDGSCAQ